MSCLTEPDLHPVALRPAGAADDFDAARVLFREYAAWLGDHLDVRAFEVEMATLERMYGPARGSLLLASVHCETAGCVAVRAQPAAGPGVCEMKRFYVRPAYRGRGLGPLLAAAAVEEGRRLGYARLVLNTLGTMTAAHAVYERLGFRDAEPYFAEPATDTRHMALDL